MVALWMNMALVTSAKVKSSLRFRPPRWCFFAGACRVLVRSGEDCGRRRMVRLERNHGARLFVRRALRSGARSGEGHGLRCRAWHFLDNEARLSVGRALRSLPGPQAVADFLSRGGYGSCGNASVRNIAPWSCRNLTRQLSRRRNCTFAQAGHCGRRGLLRR